MSSAKERIASALLATLSQDEPPPEARQKVLNALGVGSAASIVSAAAGAKAGAGATSAASVGVLGIGKAFVVGAVAAVATVQISDHFMAPRLARPAKEVAPIAAPLPIARSERPSPSEETRVEPPPPPRATTTGKPPGLTPDVARQADATRALPAASTGMPGSKHARPAVDKEAWRERSSLQREDMPRPTPEGLSGPSAAIDRPPPGGANDGAALVEEIRRLDRARAALHAGSTAQALAELDQYDADFPNGSLRPEAMVVRIELLVQTGEDARARALAEAFARAYPTSGHLSKIRQLLARNPRPPLP